ncbi:hypothetical protein QYF61_025221 [Mycteria americana]|uniref:Uncharacterized protein n=1 Tax=Mycteria americana TaxID=33587 RepID=A0AAN7PLB3_MYCAM|nr:hypothetical protein QYF61_025221 [Mycteria americana]
MSPSGKGEGGPGTEEPPDRPMSRRPQRGWWLSFHKEACGEDKGQEVQVALGEVSSQHKKEFFYSENHHSLEQLPQRWGGVHIAGAGQDVKGQGAR